MSDTHPKMARKLIETQRAAGRERRKALACSIPDSVFAMSKAAVAETHAHLDSLERDIFFVRTVYGPKLAARMKAYLAQRRAE